ncbi:MAG: Trk system potassium transporter TrkA [Christensenellales bacterium]|jgi:trk system potassium uptake protein TrkA
MKIIIVGDGKVGFTVSENLSREGHDVTIIDNRDDVLQKSIESQDIIAIKGNGASYAVLKKAGIESADLLIAATSMDEVNMVCCLVGKRLGAKHTIARIRNPEYIEQMIMMEEELGLSMIVNPELAAAEEIARLVSFPSAISIGSFVEGNVYLVEIRVHRDNPMVGKSVSIVHGKYASDVLICTVMRGAKAYIPKGDFIIKEDDHLFIVGNYHQIDSYLASLGQRDRKVRSAMIVGGGLITYYLGKKLMERGIKVTIIEKLESKCEQMYEALPGALIIHGDGTDKALLDSEGMENYDAFIALTDIDEENLIISMYGAYKEVGKVITKINRLEYSDMIRKAGIDRVISPKTTAANQIVRYVRHIHSRQNGPIETLYRIADDQVEVLEFMAISSTLYLGVPIMELPLKKDILLAAIVRDGSIIIPRGKDRMLEGDIIILVTTAMRHLDNLNAIFQ